MQKENMDVFLSVDEDEEEDLPTFRLSPPTPVKYRSCNYPNVSSRQSNIHKQEEKQVQQKKLDQLDRRTATEMIVQTFRERTILVLMLGGLFILGLYIFVLYQPIKLKTSYAPKDVPASPSNCHTSFREHDCTWDNPSGDSCLRLKNCILSKQGPNDSTTTISPNIDPERKKIAVIEELLENILLFLSGVGITGYLTYILQRMTGFIRFLRFIGRKLELLSLALSRKLKK